MSDIESTVHQCIPCAMAIHDHCIDGEVKVVKLPMPGRVTMRCNCAKDGHNDDKLH